MEEEELNEISRETLKSYIKKSGEEAGELHDKLRSQRHGIPPTPYPTAKQRNKDADTKQYYKRHSGHLKAKDLLHKKDTAPVKSKASTSTKEIDPSPEWDKEEDRYRMPRYRKEETELTELSKDTLSSYVHKSFAHGNKLHKDIKDEPDDRKKSALKDKLSKRNQGIMKAAAKIRKEEIMDPVAEKTIVEALSEFLESKNISQKAAREVELDESKDYIEQTLADADINSSVSGKTVKVHMSNLSKARALIKKSGHNDYTVVAGLNQ